MQLSIVVPVYNVAPYLSACIDSVLCQDYKDYELILVDDGSTDGISGQLCDTLAQQAPQRIHVIHQANRGLGGARNTGLAAAKGDYVLFLDSDDTLSPHALTVLERAMTTGAEVICFYMQNVLEDGSFLNVQRHTAPTVFPVALAQHPELLLDSPSACCRLWSRDLFSRTGIRFPERLRFEDLYTTGKLLLEAKSILGLEEALYLYLLRDGSIMRGRDPGYNADVMTALDSVLQWYQKQGQYDFYKDILDALVLQHIYDAAFRVLRLCPRAPVLPNLIRYLQKTVPDYRHSAHYKAMGRSQRCTLWLLRHKLYALCAGIFATKDRLRGSGRINR